MALIAPHITVRDAYLAYDKLVLFDYLNLTISAGKCTCLLGPSGVGKTTLLRLIADLINKNDKTLFHGKIFGLENIHPSSLISYMAQTDLLLPWLTALENALLGPKLRGASTKQSTEKALELFKQMGLENIENKYPSELSGGMKQRVAIIRTLMEDKPVVLMDEPFSALDAITRFKLQNLAIEKLRGRTVLVVTHDPMEALRIADEIIIMYGRPAEIKQISLNSPTPRNLSDQDVINHQEKLYEALVTAQGCTQ